MRSMNIPCRSDSVWHPSESPPSTGPRVHSHTRTFPWNRFTFLPAARGSPCEIHSRQLWLWFNSSQCIHMEFQRLLISTRIRVWVRMRFWPCVYRSAHKCNRRNEIIPIINDRRRTVRAISSSLAFGLSFLSRIFIKIPILSSARNTNTHDQQQPHSSHWIAEQ